MAPFLKYTEQNKWAESSRHCFPTLCILELLLPPSESITYMLLSYFISIYPSNFVTLHKIIRNEVKWSSEVASRLERKKNKISKCECSEFSNIL